MTDSGTSQIKWARWGTSEGVILAQTLAVLTVWRLVTCAITGLGDVEAYHWVWSRFPSASYYDHAPGIAWLIRATTSVLGDTPLGVRIGAILLFPATIGLLYVLGRDLFGARAALYACLALIATPAFHIGGVAAAPDTLLAFFWALALYALWRGLSRDQPLWIYVFGLALGLGFLSKYFAVLLVPGALVILCRRDYRHGWLRRELWIAAAVSLAATVPVWYWNAQHDWASFRYHLGGRHGAAGFSWNNTGRLIGGQVGYISPILLTLYLWAMREGLRRRHEAAWAYATAMSIPTVLFFSIVTLWTPEAEPHWPILGYVPAALMLGALVDERLRAGGEVAARARRGFAVAVGLPVALLALLYVHLLTPAFVRIIPAHWYDAGVDIANELHGWPEVGRALRAELDAMPPGTVVVAYHYVMCAQAAFALGDATRVRCLNTRNDSLDFLGLGEVGANTNAVYLRDNRYRREAGQIYRFDREERGPVVTIDRGGVVVRTFHLSRLHGLHGLVAGVTGL